MKVKEKKYTSCGDCTMLVAQHEYHPYAACLMFRACRDADSVRANLKAVLRDGMEAERMGRTVEDTANDMRC